MKSDNISYRYDEEKMAFLLERESIENPRKALDFLIDKYWWEHKINYTPINPDAYNGKRIDNLLSDEFGQTGKIKQPEKPKKPLIFRTPEQWVELKRSCESIEEWNEVRRELMEATNLSDKQKQLIINT